MSQKLLDEIERIKSGSYEVNELIIEGKVPQLIKVFSQIKGEKQGKNFFYRQAGKYENSEDLRPNIIGTHAEFYLGASFTSPERGRLIEDYFASVVEWRHSVNESEFLQVVPSFWSVEEEVELLMLRARMSMIKNERDEARNLYLRAKTSLSRMLQYIEEKKVDEQGKD